MPPNFPPFCVLHSSSTHPAENLALEEWLLKRTQPGDWRLLLYRNKPCVVVGRNQNAWRECRLEAVRDAEARIYRRLTGGGAVWHDLGNLNFSFIAARDSYCVDRQFSVVSRALEDCGIQPVRTPQNALLANGLKFSGNAFCLKKTGAIHHGTLLISSDIGRLNDCLTVPDVGGLHDKSVRSIKADVGNLTDVSPVITLELVVESLIKAFFVEIDGGADAALDVDFSRLDHTFDTIRGRHETWTWRMGDSPPFEIHGVIGACGIKITIQSGIIHDFTFTTTDCGSLNQEMAGLPDHLNGRRFDKFELEDGVEGWRMDVHPPRGIEEMVLDWVRGLNA